MTFPGFWIPATAPIISAAGTAKKENSGGLLVHKATHHFDLVNWWIDSYPQSVFALGDLLFYGKANAESRGESYAYSRYTGEAAARDDPFALFLDKKAAFKGLYLDAEKETGYIRDRNVFGEPISAEDTMAVTARYHKRRPAVIQPGRLCAMGRFARRHHRRPRTYRIRCHRECRASESR